MGTSPRSPKRTPAGDTVWRSGVRCPRAEVSSPLHSGGSDIMPSGTMTGVRGARCNRSRRRRVTPPSLALRSAKPGPGCAKGCVSPLDRSRCGTPKGERVPLDARRALQARSYELRLSAFCFLFFLSFVLSFLAFVPHPDRDGSGLPLPGSSDEGREGGEVLRPGVLIARVRIKKTHRENENLFPLSYRSACVLRSCAPTPNPSPPFAGANGGRGRIKAPREQKIR